MHTKITYFILLVLTAAGCKSIQKGIFSEHSPHEEYRLKLEDSGLNSFKAGQIWIQTAEEGLTKPTRVDIPFSEALVFDYEHLTSAGYQLSLREGQDLHVLVEPALSDTSHIFIDLFRLTNGEYKREAFAEKDSLLLNFRIKRDGEYIVRIQPELMATGLFTFYLFTDASLNFPVPERDYSSISSFFGDPRDGGRRKHEGVDVFAPRGTPALAVSSGRVSRTGTNRLGGKVVWVTDTENGYNYYYAHLDSQLVRSGMRVKTGDTLGLIGNTGNALTTPPHLHFGIYAFGRRSIDPYAFFHQTEMPLIDSLQIEKYTDTWGQTTALRTNFRSGPDLEATIIESLPTKMPFKIKGITGNWLRIELPEGDPGFVHQSLVEPIAKSLKELTGNSIAIHRKPDSSSHIRKITGSNESIKVLAEYNSHLLIEAGGVFGWIKDLSEG